MKITYSLFGWYYWAGWDGSASTSSDCWAEAAGSVEAAGSAGHPIQIKRWRQNTTHCKHIMAPN
jgi:hypothetical protein